MMWIFPVGISRNPSAWLQPNWNLISAKKNLDDQKTNLAQVITTLNLPGLADIEKRLADAEAAFKTAKTVLDLANNAADQVELQNAAQDQYDAAKEVLRDCPAGIRPSADG